jgi:hypothetical protein
MDLEQRWPILDELGACATRFPGLQLWVFGSMLRTEHPRDLDVLIIYTDPVQVTALYGMRWWDATLPPLHFIAMTPDEEHDYRFIEVTEAIPLHRDQPNGQRPRHAPSANSNRDDLTTPEPTIAASRHYGD